MTERDVVVIGGGIAGSTAALFAARFGRDTVLLNSGLPGGQLLNIGKIEDFPGFARPVAGFELCPAVQDQALEAGAHFEMVEATSLKRDAPGWSVVTSNGSISTRTVIIASGSHPKTLGLDGEQEFVGRGLSHCASCDGPLYRDQTVAVVGGGDSALQEALELTDHVARVVLIHRGACFTGQEAYALRVASSSDIDVRFTTEVIGLSGEGSLAAITMRNSTTGEEEQLAVSGLFVYVGSEPNAAVVPDGVARDHHGRVRTDPRMRTSVEGVLAAGDIRADFSGQAVSAAGDGATAAVTAHRHIASESWPVLEAHDET